MSSSSKCDLTLGSFCFVFYRISVEYEKKTTLWMEVKLNYMYETVPPPVRIKNSADDRVEVEWARSGCLRNDAESKREHESE